MAGGAVLAALFAPAFDTRAAAVLATIGVVMAAALWLAARSRRRLLTGLASVLVAFGPWGGAWVLGAPFLLLAGWLAYRARPGPPDPDVQATVAAPPADAPVDGADAAGRAARRPGRRARRTRPAAAEEAGPGRPTPNKRYTPPAKRR